MNQEKGATPNRENPGLSDLRSSLSSGAVSSRYCREDYTLHMRPIEFYVVTHLAISLKSLVPSLVHHSFTRSFVFPISFFFCSSKPQVQVTHFCACSVFVCTSTRDITLLCRFTSLDNITFLDNITALDSITTLDIQNELWFGATVGFSSDPSS